MRKAIVGILILILLLGAYGRWWQEGAKRMQERVEAELAAAHEQFDVKYQDIHVVGFPFSYEAQLTNPRVTFIDPETRGECEFIFDGTIGIGSSLVNDWAWVTQSGKVELIVQMTKDTAAYHWVQSGDVKYSCRVPKGIAPYSMDLRAHLHNFYRGFKAEFNDFSITDLLASDSKPMVSLSSASLDWKGDQDSFSVNCEIKGLAVPSNGNFAENYSLKAHGRLPNKPAYLITSWETLPTFALVVDQLKASGAVGEGSLTLKLGLDNTADFVGFDFVLDSLGSHTKLMQENVRKTLADLAQVNLEELPVEQRRFYVTLRGRLPEIQALIPDPTYFGKTKVKIDFHVKALKTKQPAQYPQEIILDLDKLSWSTEPYSVALAGNLNLTERLSPAGKGALDILHYHQLLEDATVYGLRWYRLLAEKPAFTEQDVPALAAKIVPLETRFLESLSEGSGDDHLAIRIEAKDTGEVMVGPLTAADAEARSRQLIEEIKALLQP